MFYKYCPPNSEKDDLNHTLQHSLNQPWGLYYKAGSIFPGFLSYLVQAILTQSDQTKRSHENGQVLRIKPIPKDESSQLSTDLSVSTIITIVYYLAS